MSEAYRLDLNDPLARFPGEPLVKFYNRKLRARGRDDIEWYETSGGQLRLRETGRHQTRMDL